MKASYKIFADEWLKNRNATRSYRNAYPNCTTDVAAATEGGRLLRLPQIKSYIDKKLKKISDKAELSVQRVLEEEARISLSTLKDIFDGEGTQLAPHQLPDDVARAIKSVVVKERNIFHTNGEAEIIKTYKYTFWSKGNSLARVEKYLGMTTEKIDITSNGQEITTSEEVLRRFAYMLRAKQEESNRAIAEQG